MVHGIFHHFPAWSHWAGHLHGSEKLYLEVRAEGGQNNAMAGELLPTTAQGHITEGVVEAQAVEALQDSVGVPGFHEQVVLAARRGRRGGGSDDGGILYLEGDVQMGRQRQPGVDSNHFSHVFLR